MSAFFELVGRLPSLRQKSVPIAQTWSESAEAIVVLATAVPGSLDTPSGTQGEALGGHRKVPMALGRELANPRGRKGVMGK